MNYDEQYEIKLIVKDEKEASSEKTLEFINPYTTALYAKHNTDLPEDIVNRLDVLGKLDEKNKTLVDFLFKTNLKYTWAFADDYDLIYEWLPVSITLNPQITPIAHELLDSLLEDNNFSDSEVKLIKKLRKTI